MANVMDKARKGHKKMPKELSARATKDPSRASRASRDQILPLPKDETEQKLEKLLFGDDAGFLQALEAQQPDGQLAVRSASGEQKQSQTGDDDVENLADENLFFLDHDAALSLHGPNEDNESAGKATARNVAWVDSDDERLTVSLSNNSRLRKLRNAETDDVVDGREYVKRLRRKYEQLHPAPAWAKFAAADGRAQPKRRRLSNGIRSDGSDSLAADSPIQPSTESLADLLRTAGSLTRPTTSSLESSQRRRVLRPDVLDIERTRDVTPNGPSSVDCLQFHPEYPILISSGPSSTISIHHITLDQRNPNPLLTSLHIKKTPLHSTAFLPSPRNTTTDNGGLTNNSTTVYLSSRRRYIHTWSLSTGHISKISRPFNSSSHLRTTQRSTEAFRLSPCGRYVGFVGTARKGGGHINVFSVRSGLQWLCSCRVDSRGGVADFAWWADGNGFVAAGKNGECSEYDIEERRVIGRWIDDGAVGTTVIALGGAENRSHRGDRPLSSAKTGSNLGGDRWVAVGSSSGIVNIYDRSKWSQNDSPPNTATTTTTNSNSTESTHPPIIPQTPKPTRVLTHLTTPTSHLLISPDGQLLVMASRWKKDAIRLVHLPSCTVYRNWPTQKTPLGRISSVALGVVPAAAAAAGTGAAEAGLAAGMLLLAVGNEQGAIRLWEIKG